MASIPGLPQGGAPTRRADRLAGPALPARYVRGLLLGQGSAWLIVAAAGLGTWIGGVLPGLSVDSKGGSVLWAFVQLLAISVAAGLGAAEIGMACRLHGGPIVLLAIVTGIQGLMVAAGLIVAALIVMLGGAMLELVALGGLSGPVG
jgi:hypothetical protein